ncbi:MAG: S41 family peptidase [Muribaculaceae bacterium]|nr:S41 family peptidase [Muribaculaceae bacterium]MDE6792828.1 S41 family peptidase [Muribaculaceae bacterium]
MLRKFYLLLMTAFAAVCIFPVGASSEERKPQESHDMAVNRNLNIFNSIVKQLELNYVDTIRPKEAFDAAIGALLSTVDPYTVYYDSEDRQELLQMTTGEYDFGGIGSFIMERNGSSYISEPKQGAPAALAGLRSGDKIIRVDSVDTSNFGSAAVTKLLRGPVGTPLEVTVVRPFVTDSVLTFNLVRGKLTDPSVPFSGVINGNTGYIRLTSFIATTGKEVKSALEEFKKNPEVTRIVLDLRGNGGGLLESAVDVLGNFLPKGTEVLRTKGRDGRNEKIYKTTHSPIYPDIPLAVIIDGGSASSSEITAGALQDLDRAVLIGSRSFGKGLVQRTLSLPYDGLLKVTEAKYYIPSGRLIQALDYSHRNPDGSVAPTPDSLTNVYHTLHGREVRDGGGLMPDVKVDWDGYSRLTYNLVKDFHFFDFANRYANTHESIASPEEFTVTDEIYADFKNSVSPENYNSDKICEEYLDKLKELVEKEGYMTDETKAAFETLTPLLKQDINKEFDAKRNEVGDYLEGEIVERYYHANGKLRQELKNDKAVKEAERILSDPTLLKKTLGHDLTANSAKGGKKGKK